VASGKGRTSAGYFYDLALLWHRPSAANSTCKILHRLSAWLVHQHNDAPRVYPVRLTHERHFLPESAKSDGLGSDVSATLARHHPTVKISGKRASRGSD
jgi:hypothetical protein